LHHGSFRSSESSSDIPVGRLAEQSDVLRRPMASDITFWQC
jgi:hypothetical protein